jgi:hypothetical protein
MRSDEVSDVILRAGMTFDGSKITVDRHRL